MKKFRIVVLIIFTLAVLIHIWVWFADKNLYGELQDQRHENQTKHLYTIKEIRLSLEAQQKKEITIYGRTENESVVHIPVDRAIFYYLRNLHHK